MKKETLLTTVGRAHDGHNGVVNMPAYRASTILFHNLSDFRAGERGEYKHPTYGRYGTPSTEALEEALAKVEGADRAIVTASGLSAIVTTLLAFLKTGDHVLIVDSVYGPVRRFCDQMLKRMNIEYTYYHPLIGADIAKLIQPNTKMVYLESPGSLTFEVQDLPAISKAAKAKGCLVVSDSTWATPFYQDPFALGVDIVIHSATKYISGHSDLVMGTIACKEEHYSPLLKTYRHMGATPSGDNCFFAQRGLRTMPARLRQHADNGMAVAQWLQKHPRVERVIHPALPGSPGHELWKRDFTGATSLFAFTIKDCKEEGLARMIDNLQLFGLGYSWGGYESLIIPFDITHRKHIDWPYKGQPVRVHIGLEHVDDIIRDLDAGFARL
ncbi:MAG: cystathionine beta-lyase [Rickettsiales bacterium]|nr:cystathionine beta-lyase [Rickettsiales bacterium]